MVLIHPYTVPTFADVIRMSSIKLRLAGDQQISGRGKGKIIVHDMGPKYWEADVTLINMENDLARHIQALIEALDESINDFYLYDPRAEFPVGDPGGLLFGPATPSIGSLNSNNKQLQILDLPAGYVLRPGTMFHFNFGDPSMRALHRIVDGGTANGSGALAGVEVRPHILPGAEVGAALKFIKPAARFKMIPGSFDPGTARQMMTTGMGFKCRQVF